MYITDLADLVAEWRSRAYACKTITARAVVDAQMEWHVQAIARTYKRPFKDVCHDVSLRIEWINLDVAEQAPVDNERETALAQLYKKRQASK